MIIQLYHLELYAKTRECEALFYHSRKTLARHEELVFHAKDFLAKLSDYERIVPPTTRNKLRGFEDAKELAGLLF